MKIAHLSTWFTKNDKKSSGGQIEPADRKPTKNSISPASAFPDPETPKKLPTSTSADYTYTDVDVYRPSDRNFFVPEFCDRVFFFHEPTNKYDDKAILVTKRIDGTDPIGYLNKGKLRNMVTDWIDRGDTYQANVSSKDDQVQLQIFFWRDDDNDNDDDNESFDR